MSKNLVRNHVRVPRHVRQTASLGAMVIGAVGAHAQALTAGVLVQVLQLGAPVQAPTAGVAALNLIVVLEKVVAMVLV